MRTDPERRPTPALELLKTRGPMNAPELAGALGVTATAARQQLEGLQREGLVTSAFQRRRVGRPARVWTLTGRAHALFPQAYGPFAVSILRQIRDVDGEEKLERLLARRTRELAAEYRRRTAGLSDAARIRELARIRAEEGYMARSGPGRLVEHHCPIAAIAAEFPMVCRFEKQLFEAVLGRPLDRTDHLASGGAACVYRTDVRSAKSDV